MKRTKLKQARERKKLTQEQLANELGIAEVTVRKIESGKTDPGSKLAVRFANYFHTQLDELFPDIFSLSFDTKSIKNHKEVSK